MGRAKLLALLVAAVLVGVPAVVAATASAGPTPRFESPISAADVIKSLAAGAGTYGAQSAYGWLVTGRLGNAQLDAIHREITAINEQLTALRGEVDEIRKAQKNSDCEREIGQLDNARAAIDRIWPHYLNLTVPGKYTQADRDFVTNQINALDPGHYRQLVHNKLAAASPGARTLIVVCGEAVQARDGRFLTSSYSLEVRDLLAYWQIYEAKLVTLQVEIAHGAGANGVAKADATTAAADLDKENRGLKRPIPDQTFLDTRPSAACRGCTLLWTKRPEFVRHRPAFHVNQLLPELPTASMVFDLFAGCCGGTSAEGWLKEHADVDWSQAGGGDLGPHGNWPSSCQPDGTPRAGVTPSTFIHTNPVLWTRSSFTFDHFAVGRICYPPGTVRGTFSQLLRLYGVGVSIRNRDHAGSLHRICGSSLGGCAYPLVLPGVAFREQAVEKHVFVYGLT